MTQSPVFRIATFYTTAIILCNIFRFDLFGTTEIFTNLPAWTQIFTLPLQSFGIFIGSLIALYWLSQQRPLSHSLTGTSAKWSWAMALVPVVLFSILGLENSRDISPHLFGFIISIALFIYALFEEYGWRGYLEDELKDWSEGKRVLLIGTLWYAWHLSFLKNPDPLANLKFFGIILLGTWGIGKVIQSTKSVISAACFHMIFNVLILKSGTGSTAAFNDKLLIIGICIVLWVVIVKVWEREVTQV